MKEARSGGVCLAFGSTLILATIFFEYAVGWLDPARPEAQRPAFVLEHWEAMAQIWTWQTAGHVACTIGYLLLMKATRGILAVAWAVMTVSGLLVVVAMLLTLGSYQPALLVYADQPALFDSVGGAIRTVYRTGGMGTLLFLPLLLAAGFARPRLVSTPVCSATLAIVATAIVIGAVTSVPFKLAGAAWFLQPLVLGLGYWRGPLARTS